MTEEKGLLSSFAEQHKEEIYQTIAQKLSPQQKMDAISVRLADFYHKAFSNNDSN
ncbi:hypothetical protein RCZ04_05100 [Capnocytophaga sp. HP1101]